MADTSPCPRCHTLAKVSAKHPLCTGCLTQLVRTARQEQERDYLARWLSTRADDESKTARRLRRVAEQQDIDWRHPPATMLLFDARLAALMALYRPARAPRKERAHAS